MVPFSIGHFLSLSLCQIMNQHCVWFGAREKKKEKILVKSEGKEGILLVWLREIYVKEMRKREIYFPLNWPFSFLPSWEKKPEVKNLKVRPTTTSWLFSFSFLFVNQTTKKKISSLSSLLVSFFLLPLSLFFAKHSVGLNVPKPLPMSSFMSLLVFLFYFEISNFLYLHSYKTFYFLFFL